MSFNVLFPNCPYPFAVYKNSFQPAQYFLREIEKLKTELKPFQFIVSRSMPNNNVLFDTNIKVTLEEYSIVEEVEEGFDVNVNIKLKQYRDYTTKTMQVSIKPDKPVIVEKVPQRPINTAPNTRTYTVVKGDCLWNIARKYYGNGNQYMKIYNANQDKIKKPSLIYPGQVFIIP